MPASQSTKKRQLKPPGSPFTLTKHPTRRWVKKLKVEGKWKLCYFGRVTDEPDEGLSAARAKLEAEWSWWSQGKEPPPVETRDGLSLKYLCNRFLTAKKLRLDNGELSPRTFKDYHRTCATVLKHFGERNVESLGPMEFEGFRAALAQTRGPVGLKNEIARVRILLKYARDERLIRESVEYGQSFDPPSATVLRKNRQSGGLRMFEADELRRILEALEGHPLRAAVLLAANAGFGNTDIANLPKSALDLDGRWVRYPRPKTAVDRKVPLWAETVEALREAIAARPAPQDPADDGLCFLTAGGHRWSRVSAKGDTMDPLSKRFGALLHRLGINGRRSLNWYAIRHTFESIAGETGDQVAVNYCMGHCDRSMAGAYRERISDERLRRVVETVRVWLFGE